MEGPIAIEDPHDPRVADYVGLTDPDLRRRVEAGGGFFVAETHLVIRRLLTTRHRVRSVLVTPRELERLADVLDLPDAPVYVASPAVMRAVAGFDIHRGALAAADRFPLSDPVDLLREASRVAVLERVNDHENLGMIFRNAAALGIDAVLLCPECSDPLYRRSVRVSVGHALTVPFTRLEPWPDALGLVRDAGFVLVALTPREDATPITAMEVGGVERIALMLGAEGPGLREESIERADIRVRIPMSRDADSLNVASAAAIAFHALRDRG
ncbi:MAG: RNA methyltransferase [Acidimicrobiia bacterium]|nr:RNA methyltransferase [Acidimicrobiia bacterium]